MNTTHLGPFAQQAMDGARFSGAWTFEQFLDDAAKQNVELWRSTYRRALIDDSVVTRMQRIETPLRVMSLLADWCTDAIGTIPYVVRLLEAIPDAEFRCVDRDQHLDLMDMHLTGVARAIPVVIVYDTAFRELAWWGPRPIALHQWTLGDALQLDKEERNKYKRGWYARDRGASTVVEVSAMLEAVGRTSDIPSGGPAAEQSP
jgi:hypothetical protein